MDSFLHFLLYPRGSQRLVKSEKRILLDSSGTVGNDVDGGIKTTELPSINLEVSCSFLYSISYTLRVPFRVGDWKWNEPFGLQSLIL